MKPSRRSEKITLQGRRIVQRMFRLRTYYGKTPILEHGSIHVTTERIRPSDTLKLKKEAQRIFEAQFGTHRDCHLFGFSYVTMMKTFVDIIPDRAIIEKETALTPLHILQEEGDDTFGYYELAGVVNVIPPDTVDMNGPCGDTLRKLALCAEGGNWIPVLQKISESLQWFSDFPTAEKEKVRFFLSKQTGNFMSIGTDTVLC